MPFTAVVVTWNSANEIPGLVESVDQHLEGECELLFVDNDSGDDTVAVIREKTPQSEVIALDENVGFGPANNIGVKAASGEVVVLLNPDTVMIDDSLRALAELASGERALFAPGLLNEDGSVQISARPGLASWESALISVWPGALMPKPIRARCEPWRYDERLPAGWLTGACLVARRDLLLEFGPFDERLVMYGEDGDLGLRAWKAGVPSISAPDVARIVHLGGRSASQAFTDNGMDRKIAVRLWIIRERLGGTRAAVDLALEFFRFGSRWLTRRVRGENAENEATWLRAAFRAMRSPRRLSSGAPTRDSLTPGP